MAPRAARSLPTRSGDPFPAPGAGPVARTLLSGESGGRVVTANVPVKAAYETPKSGEIQPCGGLGGSREVLLLPHGRWEHPGMGDREPKVREESGGLLARSQ